MEEMKEVKAPRARKQPKVIDATKEVEARTVKPYVEIEFMFKNSDEPMTLKANTMIQAHGKLSKMAEERGLNYKTAFKYHNVIQ